MRLFSIIALVVIAAFSAIGILFYISYSDNERRNLRIRETLEYAYFEGQKDFMEGNIKIDSVGGRWLWISSPWDSKREVVHKYLDEYLQTND